MSLFKQTNAFVITCGIKIRVRIQLLLDYTALMLAIISTNFPCQREEAFNANEAIWSLCFTAGCHFGKNARMPTTTEEHVKLVHVAKNSPPSSAHGTGCAKS